MHERLENVTAESQPTAGVHYLNGQWFMRLDASSRGVPISEHIARTIKMSLWAEKRKKKRAPPSSNRIVTDRLANINCHQTALYAAKLIDIKNISIKNDYDFSLFSSKDFRKCASDSYPDFKKQVHRIVGNDVGIMQFGFHGGAEISHSCIVGFDEKERDVCFEKEAYGKSFRIRNLYSAHRKYSDTYTAEWAVGKLASITTQWEKRDTSSIFSTRYLQNNYGYFIGTNKTGGIGSWNKKL